MKVLIVLYEGFTEYEYQIPVLAFHHLSIPFDAVGLEASVVTGMVGLKASLTKTLADLDTG
jgi:putative intracellular protease/amidase